LIENTFDGIETKLIEAEETKTFVESALTNATDALTGIQKAKDLFFGGESPSFFQGVKAFFGFTLAQMENSPHFTSKEDLMKAREIERLLLSMDKVSNDNEERFLKENLFGLE
jgi:hypothetical protein